MLLCLRSVLRRAVLDLCAGSGRWSPSHRRPARPRSSPAMSIRTPAGPCPQRAGERGRARSPASRPARRAAARRGCGAGRRRLLQRGARGEDDALSRAVRGGGTGGAGRRSGPPHVSARALPPDRGLQVEDFGAASRSSPASTPCAPERRRQGREAHAMQAGIGPWVPIAARWRSVA